MFHLRCVYFSGLACNTHCRAGVAYADVNREVRVPGGLQRGLPCIREYSLGNTCKSRRWATVMPVPRPVRHNLRGCLVDRGLSHEELAAMIGCGAEEVGQVARGARAMSAAFGRSVRHALRITHAQLRAGQAPVPRRRGRPRNNPQPVAQE